MSDESFQVSFVPWEQGRYSIFPEITVLLVGTDIHWETFWPDPKAREVNLTADRVWEMLGSLPWTHLAMEWEKEREPAICAYKFRGFIPLLKHSVEVSIIGHDMRA